MNEIGQIKLRGKSGDYFIFSIFDYTVDLPELPGIYIASRAIASVDETSMDHEILFVGETNNLKADILETYNSYCFPELGVTHLLWLGKESSLLRWAITKDLIDFYDPLCNG